jgi:acyl-CoA synthetase (AMP-forming)/AMP-acid ligase II
MPPAILTTPRAAHLDAFKAAGAYRDATIADLALAEAAVAPDRLLFAGDRPVTLGALVADASALAASIAALCVAPGEVISFQTPNWAEAAVINLAAAMGGWVINPIVHIYRDAEVAHMLADARARLFFVAARFRSFDGAAMVARIRHGLPDLAHVALVRGDAPGGYDELLAAGRGRAAPAGRVDPHGVKMLLYTSGTTGRPKGVLHSHATLDRVARCAVARWGIRPGDHVLMPSPVTHISGYSNGLELPLVAGTTTVLMEAWDAAEAARLIDTHQVVATVAATPFLTELAAAARAAGTRLPSLRVFACGGAPVAAEQVAEANAAFARPCAFRVFGASEVPLVTLGWPDPADTALAAATDGEVGDYAVRLVDDAGAEAPPGAEGEILARGPAMFLGYADPAQTDAALTPDGFFRTGDLGRLTPERALIVTGRKKDLIIRGGENISPKEIEDALLTCPGVAQAAVVAMPHARLGEGVCAFIVAADGAVTVEAMTAHMAASGLARQKVPEAFHIVNALPATASGKVRKDLLRDEARRLAAQSATAGPGGR